MKYFLLGFFTLFSWVTFAQYTSEINSNRPSKSMGAYSVSEGIFQIESGLGYQKDDYNSELFTNIYTVDLQLRYGALNENLELIADFTHEQLHAESYGTKNTDAHFKKMTFGAKYLIFDSYKNYEEKINPWSWKANQRYKWRRLVPSVALYAAADFKSKLIKHPEMPDVSLKAGIFTQQQISDHFSFVTNLIVENAESDDFRNFGYIATLSYGFNQKWSVFIENQGFFRKYKEVNLDFDKDDFITRTGLTYLAHNNLQFDFSAGTTFGNQPVRFIAQVGASWRNHKVFRKKVTDDELLSEY